MPYLKYNRYFELRIINRSKNQITMKNTIVLTIGVLLFITSSCGGSTKGHWTEEDKTKLKTEFNKQRSQLDQILGKEKTDKWVNCAIDKMEQKFNNPEAADNDTKAAEKIGEECMKEIIGM